MELAPDPGTGKGNAYPTRIDPKENSKNSRKLLDALGKGDDPHTRAEEDKNICQFIYQRGKHKAK